MQVIHFSIADVAALPAIGLLKAAASFQLGFSTAIIEERAQLGCDGPRADQRKTSNRLPHIESEPEGETRTRS